MDKSVVVRIPTKGLFANDLKDALEKIPDSASVSIEQLTAYSPFYNIRFTWTEEL